VERGAILNGNSAAAAALGTVIANPSAYLIPGHTRLDLRLARKIGENMSLSAAARTCSSTTTWNSTPITRCTRRSPAAPGFASRGRTEMRRAGPLDLPFQPTPKFYFAATGSFASAAACCFSAAALSVASHVKSGSFTRPKCPYAAVLR